MKLRYLAPLLAIVLIACLIACAAVVDVTKTAKGFYDQTNPNDVEILKTVPKSDYIELGTVTATGFPPDQTAKMHNAIRSKAAALGATAVILTEEGIIDDGWGGAKKWATGVAVRYK